MVGSLCLLSPMLWWILVARSVSEEPTQAVPRQAELHRLVVKSGLTCSMVYGRVVLWGYVFAHTLTDQTLCK